MEFVAVTEDGRIVLADADSGKIIRVLAEAEHYTEESNGDQGTTTFSRVAWTNMDLSRDGDVFFARTGNKTCTSVIRSVSITGGAPKTVVRGHYPAISPDGNSLAYVRYGSICQETRPDPQRGEHQNPIVIRDLRTGDERIWQWATDNEQGVGLPSNPIEWSPDGRALVWQRVTVDGGEIRTLDPKRGATILDSRIAVAEAPDHVEFDFRENGALVHVKPFNIYDVDPAKPTWGDLVLVDPSNGEVKSRLHRFKAWVQQIDFDTTGQYLLVIVSEDYDEQKHHWRPPTLYEWSGEKLRRIGIGFVAAEW